MLYDGFGAVLTNTLPLTLTGTLPGHPDAATGLVHQDGGRWYDPALGRPLQPNAAGGPPIRQACIGLIEKGYGVE